MNAGERGAFEQHGGEALDRMPRAGFGPSRVSLSSISEKQI
jgi:hypothetical protein